MKKVMTVLIVASFSWSLWASSKQAGEMSKRSCDTFNGSRTSGKSVSLEYVRSVEQEKKSIKK